MKIQVTVDLNDFYSEEDEMSFSEQVKSHIAYTVKHEILLEWKRQITDDFNNQIRQAVSEEKERLISNTIEELIASEKVVRSQYTKEQVSVRDFAIESLKNWWINETSTTIAFNKILQKESERISEDLKKRYDLMFASQIITKLNEAGMLKEDVAKLILG